MAEPHTSRDEFHYKGPDPTQHTFLPGETVYSLPPILEGPNAIDLGEYRRDKVSNVDVGVGIVSNGNGKQETEDHESNKGRAYFDLGLRLLLSYQHEMAAKCFLACLKFCPYAALAHGLVAICHSPNYNFKGRPYYESACHYEDVDKDDELCIFPSQQVADRHSAKALQVVEDIKKMHKKQNNNPKRGKGGKKGRGKHKSNNNNNNKQATTESDLPAAAAKPNLLTDVEVQLLQAIRILTSHPGIDPGLAEEMVGRPFADACRALYQNFPQDPEIAYFFAESLVVLNAWQLYEYPTGKPISPDVDEVQTVLETALDRNPRHAGLSHMYVHLSEMSSEPQRALRACPALRQDFPHAGHLIHMPTHIDVLIGDYENCVRYNRAAIDADAHVRSSSPSTAGPESFYFGYIVHNYHMAVYGAILGAFEQQARSVAGELTQLLTHEFFEEFPDLTSYLESYSALDVHVLVRFGRWEEILELPTPRDKKLMLYRTASLAYARGLAYASTGRIPEAKLESERLDGMRGDKEAHFRILHNNSVAQLLAVDSVMMKGEIAYHEGLHDKAFKLLRKAVDMQDGLDYDEPWGKMQPIRHALGGLLLEQNNVDEAEQVFRRDLLFHPKNPWALLGLIECLKRRQKGVSCCSSSSPYPIEEVEKEMDRLQNQLTHQQALEWADFEVVVPCECCKHPGES